MVGRVAQLTAQLCEYGGRGTLGKRRRDATVIRTAARSLTKNGMRARLTAPGGSEMTGIGMAVVVMRLGAGTALAVTGLLVLPLKIVVPSKPPPYFVP